MNLLVDQNQQLAHALSEALGDLEAIRQYARTLPNDLLTEIDFRSPDLYHHIFSEYADERYEHAQAVLGLHEQGYSD